MPTAIETQRILQAHNFGCVIFVQSVGELLFGRIVIGYVRLVMLFVMQLNKRNDHFKNVSKRFNCIARTSIISAQMIGSRAL